MNKGSNDNSANNTPHLNQQTANAQMNNRMDSFESDVLDALKTLQLQHKRLARLQETSYQWQLQHHANLKKIMNALNCLADVLQEKTGIKTFRIEPEEDVGLLKSSKFDDLNEVNFHELVMAYAGNMHSSDILKQVANITSQQFEQLRDESATLILPVMIEWLCDDNMKNIAIVFVWEASRKFPQIFTRSSVRNHVGVALQGVEKMIDGHQYGDETQLSIDELSSLKNFFLSLYTTN